MSATALVAASLLAIVVQDQAQLRSAPKDAALAHVMLWQGDALEIRGNRLDYLQVYDHRRERAGFIKASYVRQVSLQAEDAAQTLAVLRFVRDTPGAESLGISYAAAYLKAAPAPQIGPEVFDALGSMAERLARRASQGNRAQGKSNAGTLAAHLESVAQYGVQMRSFERRGSMQICYEGEAWRRVLAFPQATAEQKARAALGLTRPDCIDPALPVLQKNANDEWRAQVLEQVVTSDLPGYLKNRIHMRRAGVWASLAFQRARQQGDQAAPVQAAARLALQELASVNKHELPDEDQVAWQEAGMRVGAVRYAAEFALDNNGSLQLRTSPGEPGQTCVEIIDSKTGKSLHQRCTWGVVWRASAKFHPAGHSLALAVQPLDGWRELWLFKRSADGWQVDVLPPAATEPELGYAEFAGWVPGGEKFLLAREVNQEARYKRVFEVLSLASLQTELWADRMTSLQAFNRWQDAGWKRGTLMLR